MDVLSDSFLVNGVILPQGVGVSAVHQQQRDHRQVPGGFRVADGVQLVNFDYLYLGRSLFEGEPTEEGPETNKWRQQAVHQLKQAMADYLCKWSFNPQVQALKNGFKDVLPLEWCRLFDHTELAILLGGTFTIDLDDWAQNLKWVWSVMVGDPDAGTKRAFEQRFWAILRQRMEADGSLPGRVLNFATGFSRPPRGGFAELTFTFEVHNIVPGGTFFG